jgi:coproporphyrinogen III oxidase-like Fe-S oxidoreductase
MGLIKTAIQFGGAYALLNAGSKAFDKHEKTRLENQREQQAPYQTMNFVAPQARSHAYTHQPYCNGQCGYCCNAQ